MNKIPRSTLLQAAVGALLARGVGRLEPERAGIDPQDLECPPLPPTRMRHKGDKVDAKGRVSALCFEKPHPINLKRETWVMRNSAVDCPKCKALILARLKTPNEKGNRPA